MATATENAAVKIEELPAPTIGENPDWSIEYNSLPAGNKKLIEFIVGRKLIAEKEKVIIKDEGSFKDQERRNHMPLSPRKLLDKALEEEQIYTKGREDKLNQYEDEYHEALKQFNEHNEPMNSKKPEKLIATYGLKLEELKEWDKLKPAQKLNKITKAIEAKYKGIPKLRYDGLLKDLEGFEQSNNLLGFIRKENIKLEELKEWDKLKPAERQDKVGKAIDNKYVDKYLDVMFEAEHRVHATGIKSSNKTEREQYKAGLIAEYNVGGIKRVVSESIVNDHYYIVSQLNNVFQPQREAPDDGWKRGNAR